MYYYHLNIDNKHTKKGYHKLKIYLRKISVSNIFYSNIYKTSLFIVFVAILIYDTSYISYLFFRLSYVQCIIIK